MTTKYKLVRIEPTEEMIKCFNQTVIFNHDDETGFIKIENLNDCIKAMLEAAPAQESEPVGEVVIEKDTQLVSDKEMGGATDTYSYIEVARTRAKLNCSLDVGTKLFTHPPADKADAERYKQALQNILDCNYQSPRTDRGKQCAHDKYYWEDCTSCIDDYIQSVLNEAMKV